MWNSSAQLSFFLPAGHQVSPPQQPSFPRTDDGMYRPVHLTPTQPVPVLMPPLVGSGNYYRPQSFVTGLLPPTSVIGHPSVLQHQLVSLQEQNVCAPPGLVGHHTAQTSNALPPARNDQIDDSSITRMDVPTEHPQPFLTGLLPTSFNVSSGVVVGRTSLPQYQFANSSKKQIHAEIENPEKIVAVAPDQPRRNIEGRFELNKNAPTHKNNNVNPKRREFTKIKKFNGVPSHSMIESACSATREEPVKIFGGPELNVTTAAEESSKIVISNDCSENSLNKLKETPDSPASTDDNCAEGVENESTDETAPAGFSTESALTHSVFDSALKKCSASQLDPVKIVSGTEEQIQIVTTTAKQRSETMIIDDEKSLSKLKKLSDSPASTDDNCAEGVENDSTDKTAPAGFSTESALTHSVFHSALKKCSASQQDPVKIVSGTEKQIQIVTTTAKQRSETMIIDDEKSLSKLKKMSDSFVSTAVNCTREIETDPTDATAPANGCNRSVHSSDSALVHPLIDSSPKK